MSHVLRLATALLWGALASAHLNAEPHAGAHRHEHAAPHAGELIELGEEFAHVELLRDVAGGRVTAWILDGEAQRGVPIAQAEVVIAWRTPSGAPLRLVLRAVENPLSGERVGSTSQFTATHPQLKRPGAVDGEIERIELKGRAFERIPVRLD